MFSCSCPRPWVLKTAKKTNDEQEKVSGSHFLGEGYIPGFQEEGDVKTSRKTLGSSMHPAWELGFFWWPRSVLGPRRCL